MKKPHGNRAMPARGFTLIELLVTVVIVGILASVALPLSELSRQREKESELRQDLRDLRGAIDAYKHAADEGRIRMSADQSGYPPNLSALVDGVPDAKSVDSRKMYFLRRIPRDPFSESDGDSKDSWGKRSYDSPPDAPHEGKDIYDVYSLSDGVGLNGIPYRKW